VNPLPVCSVTPLANDTVCIYQSPFAVSAVPPGGILSGAGITGDTLFPLIAGQGNILIAYHYTDANGCTSSANDSVYVDMCIGIDEVAAENNFKLYPNPTNGKLTVSTGISAIMLEITDVQGKERLVLVNPESVTELDLASFAEGLYFIRLITSSSTFTRPVVIGR
jgi:hypothetical protein